MANNNWIKIEDKMPLVNEIIYYKGNLRGQEGRHMGEGFIELPDGRYDQFDEWVPKNIGHVTMKIMHIDGKTKIEAKGHVVGGLFTAEYKHQGMIYGATIPLIPINV